MEYSIDHKSPVPLHIQAENLLRAMIADPEYLNGKFLPNEAVSNDEMEGYLYTLSLISTRGWA